MQPKTLIPEPEQRELAELCTNSPKSGVIIELGVYRGGTAYVLAGVANGRPLHLFDTFTGMASQDEGDIFSVGHFSDTSVEAVQAAVPSAIIHAGIFPETFPHDINEISFAHIDCDHYAPTKAAIELFWPRMLHGGIMAFDDSSFQSIRNAVSNSCLASLQEFRTARKMLYYIKGLS